MKKLSNCSVCGIALTGRQTKFCSIACKNRLHQSYWSQKLRGVDRKIQIVKEFGWRCSVCGYDKNLAALAFHHVDSPKKEFKLDMRSLSNRSIGSVRKELVKCVLVCHNCHAEIHYPELGMECPSLSRLL